VDRIYLEYKDVSGSSGSESLGVPLAGHLYLVKRDETGPNNAVDRVIRGGPESGDLHVIASDLLNTTNDAYGLGESPETRGSFDITGLIPGGVAAWDDMAAFADGIENPAYSVYDYELPGDVNGRNHTANSNAVILTVLNSMGVDVREIESVENNPFFLNFPGATGDVNNLGPRKARRRCLARRRGRDRS
jgi:hypothetical protein